MLKNEHRALLEDARSLFAHTPPMRLDDKNVRRVCWDLPGFTTWPQCGESVRVVRSCEQTSVRRRHGREQETVVSEWFWVTSLPVFLATTETIVRAGHGRWGIENHAFNELSNQWHGDHAYRYTAHALLACTLLLFIAYNLFHAFLDRNLKPQVRAGRSEKYWADLIAAEFVLAFHRSRAPPRPPRAVFMRYPRTGHAPERLRFSLPAQAPRWCTPNRLPTCLKPQKNSPANLLTPRAHEKPTNQRPPTS